MPEPWYVKRAGRVLGPFGDPEIRALIGRGTVDAETPVRRGTDGEWTPAACAGLPVAEAAPVDARPAPTADEPATWHFARDGVQSGPHSLATLRGLVAAGTLGPGDLAWSPGMEEWRPCGLIPELASARPVATATAAALDEPEVEVEVVGAEDAGAGAGRPAWLLPAVAAVVGVLACSLGLWALSRSTGKPGARPAPPPAVAGVVPVPVPVPAPAPAPGVHVAPFPPVPPPFAVPRATPPAPAPAAALAATPPAEMLMRQVMTSIRGRRLEEARELLARYREAAPPRDDGLADRLERDIETASSRDEADRLAASLDDASLRASVVNGGRALAERLGTAELRAAYRTTLNQALRRELDRRRPGQAAGVLPRDGAWRGMAPRDPGQPGMAPMGRRGASEPQVASLSSQGRTGASLDDVLAKPAEFVGKPILLEGLFKLSTRVGPVKDRDRPMGLSMPLARNDERTVCTGDRPIAGSDLYLLVDASVADLLRQAAARLDMRPSPRPTYRAILGATVRPVADDDLRAAGPAPATGPLAIVVDGLEVLGLCDYMKVADHQYDEAFRVLAIDRTHAALRYGDGALWVEHFGGEEKFVKPVRQKLQQVQRRLAAEKRQAVAEAAFGQAFAGAMRAADTYNGIRAMQDAAWRRALGAR
ncbi:hypothetical protein OJF2_00040 [Aquisphaera giovannonii]|uniref:GYF domain-containing protein n=1 Tax=Aquisphaera giovannonii TaxID=406548 RepID=A0A5B9VU01_9BACT|nr:DUF4339 domain-containing protein [Aquisphaera giovannonii]QEH31539.1 hypothetical protein OJF2_00040 [Aquisphaera giovannonii]